MGVSSQPGRRPDGKAPAADRRHTGPIADTHRTTLNDVARHAGVSRTAASFVLNGHAAEMRIAAATEERVRRAVRELDYRPNLMARSLTTRLSRTIGLLSDCVAVDGFSAAMIDGCVSAAVAAEHMLYVGEFGGDEDMRDQVVEHFLDRQVDGVVYAAPFVRPVDVPPGLQGVPLVMANCVGARPSVASVISDELEGGRLAGEHLLQEGHRGGIYLVGETPEGLLAATERRQGLGDALRNAGERLAGQIDCRWWPESAYEAVSTLLRDQQRPSALVCLNDRVAMGAYQALDQARLPIPDAVSIVSFDDSMLAPWLRPRLTSVAFPLREIGERAVELVLDPDTQPQVHRLPMQLRPRDSVGPPA
jgi:LacI family transcriptional regulator